MARQSMREYGNTAASDAVEAHAKEQGAARAAHTGDKKFIQKAIKRPGALHEKLHVPEGQKIPAAKVEKAAHSKNKLLAEEARFDENVLSKTKK